MPKIVSSLLSPFKMYQEKWRSCQLCGLCEGRKNVVLYRGTIPCDVLVVGEAPGRSEDQMGLPFVGPAGHLLDEMLKYALADFPGIRLGFTNLVCCFPKEAVGYRDPSPKEIKACATRLQELICIAKPKLLIKVGKLAEVWTPGVLAVVNCQTVSIIHPAAILKADSSQKPLAVQRTILTVADAVRRAGL